MTATAMVEASGDTLRALYIMGENPLVSDPNLNHAEERLGRLVLLVVQDIFLTETARMAHVVLPSSAFAEKSGSYTNTERRVQLSLAALEAPSGARADHAIIADLATRLGAKDFPDSPEALFDEMRLLTPQYRGMTWERLGEFGLQWPCPDEAHPGTPILHRSSFPRGKALLSPLVHRPPAEETDAEYPLVLSTGRMLAQYHTGTMSRRSATLDRIVPCGHVELHPSDAARLGVAEGSMVTVSTRRGSVDTRARLTADTPVGTLFMPFHFAEAAANRLTNDALDPVAAIPEFKVCAARIRAADPEKGRTRP
jgi:predicted molibdopterin-dependent oxidoreductase YjgC